jgi:hypothetical protein
MAESRTARLVRMQMEQAEKRAQLAAEDLDRALRRFEALQAEPDEPDKGSIIRFDVKYPGTQTTYTYVALRAPNGGWYRTGSDGATDWDGLTALMYRDETAKQSGLGFYLYTGKTRRWVGREQS